MPETKIAFVTGASRGIGKATALALAERGFDLVLSARTVSRGEQHHDIAVPGSLEETAELVRAAGRQALTLPMDLLQPATLEACWAQVMHEWGRVDVLINNAVYQGEGTLTRVLDLREEDLQRVFQGNVFAQVKLTQLALRHMQAHGGGRIMNLVSDSAMLAPVAPVDRGGWSFAYAASKAALQVLAGIVKVELESDEVLVFNVEPGLVLTEAMQERGMDEAFASRWGGAPPSVPAAVMAWLATDAGAREFHGELVSAQRSALKRGLHADWR